MALGTKASGLNYNNLYGIFVGIEKFPNSSGEIRSLWGANQDARDMCDLFFNQSAHTTKKHELRLLVDPTYLDEIGSGQSVPVMNATRSNILRELTGFLKAARADDLLLLFISTHGIVDFDDYFFIPCDGQMDNILGTGISASTLIGAIGKVSGMGVKALMIIDTCYAGAVSFDISKYNGEFSCLLSSSPVEESYEFFDIEHGIFSGFLIEGLNGAAGKDGRVTLVGLYDYVYAKVQEATKKRQNPLLIGTMKYGTVLVRNHQDATVGK